MSRSRSAVLRVPAVLTFLIVHSSAVLADCRAEIDAAFQKLQMPGRAFRRVTTIDPIVPVIGPRGVRILGETAEFIPPDRERRILEYIGGRPPNPPNELIRVGERAWTRQGQQWLEGSHWMDQYIPPSGVARAQTLFECLGTVVFEGKTYAGYRTGDAQRDVVVTVDKIGQKQDLAKLRQELRLWRTILVDWETGLPAYQIVAGANQLDSPWWKMHYTYSRDVTIEPPAQ